jgi:hypothetical protein
MPMRAAMAWIRLCRPMSIQVSEQEHFLLETDPYPAYSTTKVGQQERPHPQAGIAVSNDSKAIEQPNDPRRSVPFLHFSNQTFPGVDPNPAISPESGSNANKGRFPGTGVESQNFSLRNEHPTNQPGSLQPSQFVQSNQGTHTLRVNEYTNLQPQFVNKSASAFASPRGDYKKDLFSANEQGPGDLAGKSAPYFHLKIVQDQVIKVDTPDPSPIPNLASSMVLEPPHDKTEIAKKKPGRGEYHPITQKPVETKSYLSQRQRDGSSANNSNFLFPMPRKPSTIPDAQKHEGKEILPESMAEKIDLARSRSESINREGVDFIAPEFVKDPMLTGSIASENALSRPLSTRQIPVEPIVRTNTPAQAIPEIKTENDDKPIIEMSKMITKPISSTALEQKFPASINRSGRESLKHLPIVDNGDKWEHKNPFGTREPSRDTNYSPFRSMLSFPQPQQPSYSTGTTSTFQQTPVNNQSQNVSRLLPQSPIAQPNYVFAEPRHQSQPYIPYVPSSNQQSIYNSYTSPQTSMKESYAFQLNPQTHNRNTSLENPESRKSITSNSVQYRVSEPYTDKPSPPVYPQVSSKIHRDLLPQMSQQFSQPVFETPYSRPTGSYHDLYSQPSQVSNQSSRQSVAPSYLDSQADRMTRMPNRHTVGTHEYQPINSAPPKPQSSLTNLHYDQNTPQYSQNQNYGSYQRPPTQRATSGGQLNLVSTPVYSTPSTLPLNLDQDYREQRHQDYQPANGLGLATQIPQQNRQYIDNTQRNIRHFG